MAVQIQLRHDLAATWLTANPILAAGEVGIEIDTRKAKIGDGTTAWGGLAYALAPQAPAVSAVAFVSLRAGQPVYANGAGQVGLASAASYATSFVAGLAASDTAATFAANLTTDFLTQSNWAAITGTALLLPGRVYFLGLTPGTFTPIAPTTPGQLVVPVGQALSTTQFHVQINQPILL